jgi:GNAT superfamily N-acetyltransferase
MCAAPGKAANIAGRAEARVIVAGSRLEVFMGALVIHRAGAGDARLVAGIHLAAWREAYAGLMPPEAAEAGVNERAARWRASFADPSRPEAVFLAARAGETPAGFAACGPVDSPRLAAAGYAGEFYAIYILGRLQRRGAGRLLMGAMTEHLLSRRIYSAGAWVLRDNPSARRFYESLGATETGIEGVWPVCGLELPDLAYGWRDLREFAAESTCQE